MTIGILDSGLGGLAVAKYLKQEGYSIILLMDQAAFPYGNKSKSFLCMRAFYWCHYLMRKGVDLIVIACNTLSVTALEFLKENIAFPILGVFDYLRPYLTQDNIFIGSKQTIAYVQQHFPIPTIDGTLLIAAIEQQKEYYSIIQKLNYQSKKNLILGCTHFLMVDQSTFGIPTINQLEPLKKDIHSMLIKKILA